MDNRDTTMNFQVYKDLAVRNDQYDVKIELETPVNPNAREAAIALTGAIVRNNYKRIYGDIKKDNELALLIKEQLNHTIGREVEEFNATSITLTQTKKLAR